MKCPKYRKPEEVEGLNKSAWESQLLLMFSETNQKSPLQRGYNFCHIVLKGFTII